MLVIGQLSSKKKNSSCKLLVLQKLLDFSKKKEKMVQLFKLKFSNFQIAQMIFNLLASLFIFILTIIILGIL